MRGKPLLYDTDSTFLGITPAGAGKTLPPRQTPSSAQDHPRRCGENRLVGLCEGLYCGSPPQVRGKLCWLCGAKTVYRITPAGAGKTPNTGFRLQFPWDHPRRCGENQRVEICKDCMLGSPPQVRGKLRCFLSFRRSPGITPAGAGKTQHCTCKNSAAEDHPRRCGENSKKIL